MKRRDFLKALGIGAAAAAVPALAETLIAPVAEKKLWFVGSNAPVGSRIESVSIQFARTDHVHPVFVVDECVPFDEKDYNHILERMKADISADMDRALDFGFGYEKAIELAKYNKQAMGRVAEQDAIDMLTRDNALFGGAAGGGKSDIESMIRMIEQDQPAWRIEAIHKTDEATAKQLEVFTKWQMNGGTWSPGGNIKMQIKSDLEFPLPNGTTIKLKV